MCQSRYQCQIWALRHNLSSETTSWERRNPCKNFHNFPLFHNQECIEQWKRFLKWYSGLCSQKICHRLNSDLIFTACVINPDPEAGRHFSEALQHASEY